MSVTYQHFLRSIILKNILACITNISGYYPESYGVKALPRKYASKRVLPAFQSNLLPEHILNSVYQNNINGELTSKIKCA